MDIKKRIQLGRLLPPNPVTVELGVAEGLFSRDILEEWKPSKHYLVDLWESHPELRGDIAFDQAWHDSNYANTLKLIAPYKQAEVLRGPTSKMAQHVRDNYVDIVYIDACHEYEAVKNDIKAWWPKIKGGGVIAFHDYLSPDYGVNRAVSEWAQANSFAVIEIPENSIADAGAYIIKPKKHAH